MFSRAYPIVASRIGGVAGCRQRQLSNCCNIITVKDSQVKLSSQNPWRRCLSTRTDGQSQNTTGYGRDDFQEPPFTDFNGSTATSSSLKDEREAEEFEIKLKILEASLNHVNTMGWSTNAIRAGAADLNLSDAIASLCTPFDLAEYFQRSANHQLDIYLKALEKKDKSLYSSLEHRLKLVIPYIDRYHQAMGLSLEPINVPRSLQVLRELSDTICISGLGDSSTDLRWYTKRTGIVSLYVATECCMVQDKSEGFRETWEFLQRRVKDYEYFETAGSTALPILESGITTLLNIIGMNRRR